VAVAVAGWQCGWQWLVNHIILPSKFPHFTIKSAILPFNFPLNLSIFTNKSAHFTINFHPFYHQTPGQEARVPQRADPFARAAA
jgi:hypothetical protein